MTVDAVLYRTKVMHARFTPPHYRFRYKLFHLLLDIDAVAGVAARLWLFSRNRFNLFSFYERDHGPRDGSALRPWIEQQLGSQGVHIHGGRVRLLCFPRMFGYAFNPLSLWFCDYPDGTPAAVLCEVRNTFGEHHNYLLHGGDGMPFDWRRTWCKTKCFHVSPFMGMQAEYRFRLAPAVQTMGLLIDEFVQEKRVLRATLTGRQEALTDSALMRCLLHIPLMTLKVMWLIHWQALKLWLRGATFHRKPSPPSQETT